MNGTANCIAKGATDTKVAKWNACYTLFLVAEYVSDSSLGEILCGKVTCPFSSVVTRTLIMSFVHALAYK